MTYSLGRPTAYLAAAFGVFVCVAGADAQLLVDSSWLASRLGDSQLVILHVGGREGYDRGHIAGARQVTEDQLSKPHDMSRMSSGDLMLELPDALDLQGRLQALGISDDSTVVVYAGPNVPFQSATRIMFTLDYAGLGARSSLLDGGIAAWSSSGHPVTTTAPRVTRGTLRIAPVSSVVADAALVQTTVDRRDAHLVDARAPVYYRGSEPSLGKRGHIPGAINIPFGSITDNAGRVVARGDLAELFSAYGVRTGDTIVVYCHIGQQATAVVFAARLLGIRARLYDGAFQDWVTNNRDVVQ